MFLTYSKNIILRELYKHVHHTNLCHLSVGAEQSNIPLYQLAKKYAIIWHTSSEELTGSTLGRSLLSPSSNINLIIDWYVPT